MKRKLKRICNSLVLLTAILCLSSCWQSALGNPNTEAKENTIFETEAGTVLFRGSIGMDSTLARSASPEAIDMTTHEFYVTIKPEGGTESEINVDQTSKKFEVPLTFGKWIITAGIRNIASQTTILVDTFEANLFANTPVFSHAFYVKPITEGTGDINLEMTVPSDIKTLGIKVQRQPDGANFDTTECVASGGKIVLNRTGVKSGAYNLVLTFYNENTEPLFSTIQTINVVTGLETKKWVSGTTNALITGNTFEVTTTLIQAWRTQRNKYYVDSEKGADTNAGGPLDQFETLSHAISIINSIYSGTTKEITIVIADNFEEELSEKIQIDTNKSITLQAKENSGAVLKRASSLTGEMILIPENSSLTLDGLTIDGCGYSGEGNIGIDNHGTFIMNSGKICGNKNTSTSVMGSGVNNSGTIKLNGGEISGNVSVGSGAGIYLNGTDITISGGIVKNNHLSDAGNTASNLFIQSGHKISVEREIAEDTEINISLGWVPKKATADTVIFTSAYGSTNSENPANFFKSDENYFIMAVPSGTTPSILEAGIALSGKDFVNMLTGFSMTFEPNFDKFKVRDDPSRLIIEITPTVKINETNNITDDVLEDLKWHMSLYYRGMEVASSEDYKLSLTNAGYTGRYDLHVYAEYMGIVKDAEFEITGFNNIYPITKKEDLQEIFQQITSGETTITRDTCINLVTDVDFSSDEYYPISSKVDGNTIRNVGPDFEGVFDGNGHTIKLGKVVSEDFVGICFTNKGTIQNIILEADTTNYPINISEGTSNHDDATNATKYSFHAFGGICHFNEGTIRNCWNKVSISDASYYGRVGGICAGNSGLIENCINSGDFKNCSWSRGKGDWAGVYGAAGGITGFNWDNGVIRNCVNYGDIWLNMYYDSSGSGINGLAGAICGAQCSGRNTAKVEYCYWRENCVRSDYTKNRDASNSTPRNWLVAVPQSYSINSIEGGTFAYNGYFLPNLSGTLSDGPAVNGQTQSLAHGTNLVNALNAYANAADPNHTYLKRWKAGTSYAAEFE